MKYHWLQRPTSSSFTAQLYFPWEARDSRSVPHRHSPCQEVKEGGCGRSNYKSCPPTSCFLMSSPSGWDMTAQHSTARKLILPLQSQHSRSTAHTKETKAASQILLDFPPTLPQMLTITIRSWLWTTIIQLWLLWKVHTDCKQTPCVKESQIQVDDVIRSFSALWISRQSSRHDWLELYHVTHLNISATRMV